MPLRFQRNYPKIKHRRILAISAGGEGSGIHCLYYTNHNDGWEIISRTVVPYSGRMASLIESCSRQALLVADLAWLDGKITQLCIEGAKNVLAAAPRALRKPHLVAFNQLTIFKGLTGENAPIQRWNLSLGDPQLLADTLELPVFSDFLRFHFYTKGAGMSPFLAGDMLMAGRFTGTALFLNIGLLSHMTVLDCARGRCLLDSDTGPGTCLINRCAREINLPEGFDRDGERAAAGSVDVPALDALATSPWFLTAAPKEASIELFDPLLQKSGVMTLSPDDKLATITALTARTAYDFFRTELKDEPMPEAIVISGGGANNSALIGYFASYFSHVPIMTSEELGIPFEMRMPLAMGLTVDAFLRGNTSMWEDPTVFGAPRIGRISLP
jgi:anhydro-N-acetylmuramic acid kinase